jgi:hypothetical protein
MRLTAMRTKYPLKAFHLIQLSDCDLTLNQHRSPFQLIHAVQLNHVCRFPFFARLPELVKADSYLTTVIAAGIFRAAFSLDLEE